MTTHPRDLTPDERLDRSAEHVQHGHEGRHHGDGSPDCPGELHHHHDERCEVPTADEDREVARRLRDVRVATTLELIDELAPSTDVARKARVRLAGVYGLAAATVDDVRDVITHLTPPPAEEHLA